MLKASLRAVFIAALLAGCALFEGQPSDGLDPQLAPMPQRVAGIAGVATGTVLGLWCTQSASASVTPAAINRDNSVTWLGHSGFVIRMGGQVVMVDPVLNEAFHTRFIIGRRIAGPPDISGLDRLDAILISHGDNDHLDRPTLSALAARFPQARLILPKGARLTTPVRGFDSIRHVDAWETLRLGGLEITPTPAVHHGRRINPVPRRAPAFGFVLSDEQRRMFHSGDTGYGPVFREIAARFGHFDMAMVPIGAYQPEAFLSDVHATPEQAVQMALDLGARRAVPHHFGTFALTPDDPALSLARFRAAAGDRLETVALPIGGTTCID